MSPKVLRVAAGIAAALAVCAPAASASGLASHDQAAAAGDPSATAASVALPSQFRYRGAAIDPSVAIAQGLVCNQVGNAVSCFDNHAQATAAAPVASAARASKPKAHAATVNCSNSYLAVFQYAQSNACIYTGSGWELDLYSRQYWYDLSGGYNDQTSAYFMGDHSGHLSENASGGGYWCPYDTSVSAYDLNLNGTGWSNRISSRYRN